MNPTHTTETEDVLREWRQRILNSFLVVAAFAMVPAVALVVADATSRPGQWPAAGLYAVLLLLLSALAFWRRLDGRIRAWGLMAAGYATAVLAFSRGGLVGTGRDYVLVLPILALILLGERPGILMSVLSALVIAAFAILADRGVLGLWLIDRENTVRLVDWISEGTYTLALLAAVMVLLALFYRFQVRVIDQERQARSEVAQARASLEEQNETLEQKVEERTAELTRVVAQLQGEIAERERMEAAVRDSERLLRDIINFMPDAAFVIDRGGKVITWNRAIEEMTGVPAQDMLGRGEYAYAEPFYGERKPILIDLACLPQEELLRSYDRVRREGEVLIGETYVTSLKGHPAYLQATASTLRDARDEISGAIEVIRDLTQRKKMEEDLQAAKEAAEAAAATKSAFLATMSHEIRTPMNAIIGMTGLLLDTPLTREQHEFAETIRFSGDALLTIINDILDFSKIEAGRMDLEEQPFLLRDCVEGAVDLLAARANEKGLNLACVLEPGVPDAIYGDVTRLRQILVNLLSNAVKFTDQGEVVLTLSSEFSVLSFELDLGSTQNSKLPGPLAQAGAGRTQNPVGLHFAVRDTGIGIAPDGMARLFQSFSQVDASTTRRFGGTGLGLAISKRLAELMGGTMWAESEGTSGKGSTFHLTIKARTAEMQPVGDRQALEPNLRGKRVLIVDDNATNRRILSLQTHSWGMAPCETGTPDEALEWLKRGDRYDVAFLDMQMPGMDGVTLAGEIRKLLSPRQLPLVLLSSLGKREPGAPAPVQAGQFAAVLAKPMKASQIHDVLVEIFAGPPEPAPAAAAPAASPYDAALGARHPLRILLAEDNRINQKLALLVLGRLGYRADVAANGLEALQCLRRQAYDVVLMDVQMPEMDGLEATRAIWREWPDAGAQRGRRPRIIAMTANAMKEDREICLAAGMDDYLSKPIVVEQLVAALLRCPIDVTGAETPDRS